MTSPDPAVDAAARVQGLLARLDEHAGVTPPTTDSALSLAEAATAGHAESLRITSAAQREAQQLLAMASQVRGEATEQAEAIIREAQVAAEQLRQQAEHYAEGKREQTTAWAREQRQSVDAVVAEIVEAARRQADEIHQHARDHAMESAAAEARRYVAQAAVQGTRDAEAIRARAREVLDRSAGAITSAQTSMQLLADEIARFAAEMQAQAVQLDELVAAAQDVPGSHQPDVHPLAEAFRAPPVEPVTEEQVPALPDGNPAFDHARPLGSLFR